MITFSPAFKNQSSQTPTPKYYLSLKKQKYLSIDGNALFSFYLAIKCKKKKKRKAEDMNRLETRQLKYG